MEKRPIKPPEIAKNDGEFFKNLDKKQSWDI
jgi:hypothetical protein